MINPALVARIRELSTTGQMWRQSPLHESEPPGQVKWMPLLNLPLNEDALGISDEGSWVRESRGAILRADKGKNLVFLLPALEIPLTEFQMLIQRSLANGGIPQEVLQTFPFFQVTILGLSSTSEHWTQLAINWCESLPLDQSLIRALLAVAKSDSLPQRIRHRAWALCKRTKSGRGNQS